MFTIVCVYITYIPIGDRFVNNNALPKTGIASGPSNSSANRNFRLLFSRYKAYEIVITNSTKYNIIF